MGVMGGRDCTRIGAGRGGGVGGTFFRAVRTHYQPAAGSGFIVRQAVDIFCKGRISLRCLPTVGRTSPAAEGLQAPGRV